MRIYEPEVIDINLVLERLSNVQKWSNFIAHWIHWRNSEINHREKKKCEQTSKYSTVRVVSYGGECFMWDQFTSKRQLNNALSGIVLIKSHRKLKQNIRRL